MKSLLAIFVALQSTFAFGLEQQEIDKLIAKKSKQIDEIADLLALDLAPFVMTTKRDISTFNYRKKSLVGLPDLNKDYPVDAKEGLNYTKEWTNTVKKYVPKETGFLGWGFYTSNNPTSSTDYAESENGEFAMIRQEFPSGSKILDIRHSGEFNFFPISNSTLKKAKTVCDFLGMPGTGEEGKVQGYGRFQKNYIGKDPICKEIFVRALSKLNVAAFLYPWREDGSSLCDSGAESSAAFVSFNPKLDASTVELIVDPSEKLKTEALEISRKPSNAKKFSLGEKTYQTYAKTALHLNSYETNAFAQSMSNFIPQDKKIQEKMMNEIREETFGCSKKYPEDNELTFDPKNALVMMLNKDINKKVKDINKSIIPECEEKQSTLD